MIATTFGPNRRGVLAMLPALATTPAASVNSAEARISDLCRKYDVLVEQVCATEDARDRITFGTAPAPAQAAALSHKVDQLHAAMTALEVEVGELRAATAEALRVKALFWKTRIDSGGLADDPVFCGLIRDICGEETP